MPYYLEHYSIAIRKRKDKLLFEGNKDEFHEVKFPFSERYWAADPFIIENDNKVYLFYELYDNIEQKGVIAYSTLNGYVASSPHIILDKPYHLSYPNIFRYDESFFMMPETAGNNCIEIYKAKKFPDEWYLEKVLVNNISACDSVFICKDNKIYLMTSEMDNTISDYPWCFVRNKLFLMDDKCNFIEFNPNLKIGDYGVRNGGAILRFNNIIRVGQDCTNNQYGKGLVFWKLSDDLNDFEQICYISSEDAESMVNWIDKEHLKLKGTHTYNISENFEVIDTSEDRRYCILLKYIHKVLRKLIRLKRFYEKK